MHNSQTTELHIRFIGSLAKDLLSSEKTATIFSGTSRGIFLLFPNNRMIFLSIESYRGPLTANLSGGKSVLPNLTQKGSVTISQDGVLFADSNIRSVTSKAKIWNPSLPTNKPLNHNERNNLIRQLVLEVCQRKSQAGMRKLLPIFMDLHQEDDNLDDPFPGLRGKIDKIRDQLAHGDWNALTETLSSLLGMGSGLTPSGDDFIIGFLLSLNRWGSVLNRGYELSDMNKTVVAAAYRDTTTLSANLIECAILGLADERLIQASDYLAVGNSQPSAISAGLLSWGNSSGTDALMGMLIAFLHS